MTNYKEFVDSGRLIYLDKARHYGYACGETSRQYGECSVVRGYRGLSRIFYQLAQPVPEGV